MDESGQAMDISLDDLQHHVVRYGLDVFPPLDVRNEITRTHDLFQALQEKWPALYQEISFNPQASEFRILASFQFPSGRPKAPTLEFTPRGPVFRFPLLLPPPLGECQYEGREDLDAVFKESYNCIVGAFPGRQVLRAGLVREAVFSTGQDDPVPWLAPGQDAFPGAVAKGVDETTTFRDDRCNLRIKIQTIEIRRQAHVSATRQVLAEECEHGLQVEFDVNNIEMKPQSDSDIDLTLERAHSLWPDELIGYLNQQRYSS